MLGDIRQAQKVYIVCGYTDMRKGLNSLVPFVQQNFGIDPYSSSLFLFCGKRCDRLKALLWEPDGLYCCTSGWTMVAISGHGMPKKSSH